MSQTIWIVFGTTGEYSDRTEWIVDAWPSEAQAKARVEHLTGMIQRLGLRYDWYRDCPPGVPVGTTSQHEENERRLEEMRKHDPRFEIDYTGTRYYVATATLKSFSDVPCRVA